MTINKAIKIATDRVRSIHFGNNQYVVQTWAPKMNATWQSDHMDRDHALAYAWEQKVFVALDQLGVEDAGELANGAAYERDGEDWRKAVRRLAA